MTNSIQIKEDYANNNSVPTADQVTLQLVLEYYDAYVEPYLYTYTSEKEDGTNLMLKLKFAHENFPHLIGLHYAPNAKYGRQSVEAKKFRGTKAYESIKNGNITKQTIAGLLKSKEHYKDMTKKLRYFFTLHTVLESPEAVYYNKNKNLKRQNNALDCDILLYKFLHGQYIHVGMDLSKDKYVAKTFLIAPGPIFIDNQSVIKISKTEKVRHMREPE